MLHVWIKKDLKLNIVSMQIAKWSSNLTAAMMFLIAPEYYSGTDTITVEDENLACFNELLEGISKVLLYLMLMIFYSYEKNVKDIIYLSYLDEYIFGGYGNQCSFNFLCSFYLRINKIINVENHIYVYESGGGGGRKFSSVFKVQFSMLYSLRGGGHGLSWQRETAIILVLRV